MTAEVEAKLNAYVMSVNTEIAGMGKATVNPNGDIVMVDLAIYEQIVTGGTADLSSEALAKFQTELIQKGESPKDWIVWWHSHANMAAYFSDTDTGTIESSTEYQYLVSLVVNRRRERKARLDLYQPFRFTKDNLEIIVGTTQDTIPDEILAEVKQKVHIKSYAWDNDGRKDGQYQLGFGKHTTYQTHDKRQGGIRSAGEIIRADQPELLDSDEIYAIIDNLREKLQEYIRAGKSADPECEDVRDEIEEWNIELDSRDKHVEELSRLEEYYNSRG